MKIAPGKDLVSRRQALAGDRTFIDLAKASAPEWAKGCDKCKFGIVGGEGYNTSPLPLYQAQPLLAEAKMIRFCDCQAGQAARRNAAGEWRRIDGNPYTDFMRHQLDDWMADEFRPTVKGERVQA